MLFKEETPITSIRRSITVLTTLGLLIKTEHKKTGPNGRPEYLWRVNAEVNNVAAVKAKPGTTKAERKKELMEKITELGRELKGQDKNDLIKIYFLAKYV